MQNMTVVAVGNETISLQGQGADDRHTFRLPEFLRADLQGVEAGATVRIPPMDNVQAPEGEFPVLSSLEVVRAPRPPRAENLRPAPESFDEGEKR